MSKHVKRGSMANEVREGVQRIVDQIRRDPLAEPDAIMLAIHDMWSMICGSRHGGSIRDLRVLAKILKREGLKLAGRRHTASVTRVGVLGEALCILRTGDFAAAATLLADFKTNGRDCPGGRVLLCAAQSWRAFALALARKHESSRKQLDAAGGVMQRIKEPGRCLPALLGLSRALLAFECGDYSGSLDIIDGRREPFVSLHATELAGFPAIAADACLLRAKALRDRGLYEQAWKDAWKSVELRGRIDDRPGKAWGWIEMARNSRFQGDADRAMGELGEARQLLQDTDFWAWRARVLDQQGDVFRGQKNLAKAGECYAEAARLARRTKDRYLLGHVVNSQARLLEDQGSFSEALGLLEDQEETWRGKKEYGKYLYLKGSIHLHKGDIDGAEHLLRQAVDELTRYRMHSHQALALDRLATVMLSPQRAGNAKNRQKACEYWAEALGLAGKIETQGILDRVKRNVAQLDAADVLAGLVSLTNAVRTVRDQWDAHRAVEDEAESRRFRERWYVGNWFIGPVAECLRLARNAPVDSCLVLSRFAEILRSYRWYSHGMAESPCSGRDVSIVQVIEDSRNRASKDLGCELKVVGPEHGLTTVAGTEYLATAMAACFRGLNTAFGATIFKMSIRRQRHGEYPLVVVLRPRGVKPGDFKRAWELVDLGDAMADPTLKPYFDRGYTGDLTLAVFLLRVALWSEIEFDARTPSVMVRLHRQIVPQEDE